MLTPVAPLGMPAARRATDEERDMGEMTEAAAGSTKDEADAEARRSDAVDALRLGGLRTEAAVPGRTRVDGGGGELGGDAGRIVARLGPAVAGRNDWRDLLKPMDFTGRVGKRGTRNSTGNTSRRAKRSKIGWSCAGRRSLLCNSMTSGSPMCLYLINYDRNKEDKVTCTSRGAYMKGIQNVVPREGWGCAEKEKINRGEK